MNLIFKKKSYSFNLSTKLENSKTTYLTKSGWIIKLISNDKKIGFGEVSPLHKADLEKCAKQLDMIPEYVEIFNLFPEITDMFYENKIFLISPTTLWIVLNSIESLLKDKRIKENSTIIFQHLKELGKEINRLEERVKKMDSHFSNAQNDLNDILITTKKISNKKNRMLLSDSKD